jgi:hypothetical protein
LAAVYAVESPLHEERDADDGPNLDSELWKRKGANTLYIRSMRGIGI